MLIAPLLPGAPFLAPFRCRWPSAAHASATALVGEGCVGTLPPEEPGGESGKKEEGDVQHDVYRFSAVCCGWGEWIASVRIQ